MIATVCPSCGSENLYQFEASKRHKGAPRPDQLPQVCRACSLIIIDGQAMPFPKEFGDVAMGLAERAEESAKEGRGELETDPDAKIEGWLQNFFKAAYLEGFFRALAYWNHHGKEGRLVRMRELWDDGEHFYFSGREAKLMSPEAYTEFQKLLWMSPGAKNAQNTENKHTTVSKSHPRV